MKSPIPDLLHGLRCLSSNLTKAEAHCESHMMAPEALLKARLYPDMFDLTRNVTTACDAAKFTAARLSQTEPPRYKDNEATFAELQGRIAKTIAFLETIPDTAFADAETRELAVPLAPEGTARDGRTYLAHFGLPNFYFHLATAYNILRHNGVPLGKRDFLWTN
jgi:uncharacterized protein